MLIATFLLSVQPELSLLHHYLTGHPSSPEAAQCGTMICISRNACTRTSQLSLEFEATELAQYGDRLHCKYRKFAQPDRDLTGRMTSSYPCDKDTTPPGVCALRFTRVGSGPLSRSCALRPAAQVEDLRRSRLGQNSRRFTMHRALTMHSLISQVYGT
jgi:hypothetical protein